ncbi:sensor histidine kinase [Thermomonospora umbrina]|uniref:Two-component system sensor histidine kinase DesK n=1 Tax=Thermomonospora umbrina TaxID=111806 RepID=A0A3D9SK05_9ACTN|nr:histidine kinase [Thermomonospora umbrina]REE96246.1 two-component system sensor histidine kinase DesK [Thermomonospora umbrina]
MLYALLLAFSGFRLLSLLGQSMDPRAKPICAMAIVLICALQFVHSRPEYRSAPVAQRAMTLTVQGSLVVMFVMLQQSRWEVMTGFFAGSLLLLTPRRVGWTAFGLIGVAMVVYPLYAGLSLVTAACLSETTLVGGIIMFSVARLAELVSAVHDTRVSMARAAVTEERLRFSRDLHDLVGGSLFVIASKGELIKRDIYARPHRAHEEAGTLLALCERALTDVRSMSNEYRTMSFSREAAFARDVLGMDEVRVDVDISLDAPTPEVDTVLAAVLREGVTNVLRHSRVRHCRIEAAEQDGVIVLSILNDGVGGRAPAAGPLGGVGGAGLANLADRLRAIDGRLSAGVQRNGWFGLVAEVPVAVTTGA